jgi:hypothetical protein
MVQELGKKVEDEVGIISLFAHLPDGLSNIRLVDKFCDLFSRTARNL